MTDVLEVLGWIFLSIVKFVFTPSAMTAAGYSFGETFLITSFGASIGVVLFYYMGEMIFQWLDAKRHSKKRRTFTRVNRLIVRMKMRFGIFGLAVTIGVVSVPIGALLVARYFNNSSRAVPALILAVVTWTLALTTLSQLVKLGFS
ncbi:MAG: hypothetical protein COA57_14505 [Flavobacteriales bacterium]|nr:MAG: hypothetical protein COA57_14505 [Flavobacteriales bacterium]